MLAEALTTGWDVALEALTILGPALAALILAGAAWVRARAEAHALADTIRDHGSPEAIEAAKAHPAVGKTTTKRLEG